KQYLLKNKQIKVYARLCSAIGSAHLHQWRALRTNMAQGGFQGFIETNSNKRWDKNPENNPRVIQFTQ
ncbi:MAG: hypothetical protein WBN40_01280, partial [Pseudomonadales bacterium]